jgi:hypothetical protein
MSVRNLLNHTNPGPIIGNITSPFVWTGKSTGWSRRVWFSEAANDRRLELQTRLTFLTTKASPYEFFYLNTSLSWYIFLQHETNRWRRT